MNPTLILNELTFQASAPLASCSMMLLQKDCKKASGRKQIEKKFASNSNAWMRKRGDGHGSPGTGMGIIIRTVEFDEQLFCLKLRDT